MKEKDTARLAWIDSLRGLAIVLMLVYHFAYQLDWFGWVDWGLLSGSWLLLARVVQFLFLGLVGVSVHMSRRSFRGQCRRALTIAMAAALVSLSTYLVFGGLWVRFGILHLIALAIPFLSLMKLRSEGLILSLIFLLWTLPLFFVGDPFAVWLYSPLDYFPPFPWLALPFVGLLLARPLRLLKWDVEVPFLSRLGRHSLLIYLLHPPVFYGFFLLLDLF